jgi:hypothetical protein
LSINMLIGVAQEASISASVRVTVTPTPDVHPSAVLNVIPYATSP